MDWADEIASHLTDDYFTLADDMPKAVAAALRKAKADGMREAARIMEAWSVPSTAEFERIQMGRDNFLGRAAEIEKGEE